jgi:hypothetical protein
MQNRKIGLRGSRKFVGILNAAQPHEKYGHDVHEIRTKRVSSRRPELPLPPPRFGHRRIRPELGKDVNVGQDLNDERGIAFDCRRPCFDKLRALKNEEAGLTSHITLRRKHVHARLPATRLCSHRWSPLPHFQNHHRSSIIDHIKIH